MNTVMTHWMYAESQNATLAVLVEYPPVAIHANEWHTASKKSIPPHTSSTVSAAVRPIYTIYMRLAVELNV